jgi:hypothetical protein
VISSHYNTAAISAVTTIGATFGIALGPMEANDTIAAFSSFYLYFYYICKHSLTL